MKKQILSVVFSFACGGNAMACGCEPGSLAFEDAFFKYCDGARAEYAAEARSARARVQQDEAERRPEGESTPAPRDVAALPVAR